MLRRSLLILASSFILSAQSTKFEYWPGATYEPAVPTHHKILGYDPGDRVSSHAQISGRSNIWLLDTGAIARRVETIPYVLTAHVHRALPATVRVEIAERIPDGCVRTDDGAELTIDATRRVLERGCLAAAVVYLARAVDDSDPGTFINDPELALLQKDARVLAASGEPLTDFSHDKYGQLEARLADGIRVRFGDEEDLDRKLRLIGPVLASIGNRLAGVTAIDLRAPSTPVVERK